MGHKSNSDTTYIVSWHPRSGTSMMMKALIAGGLEGEFSRERNRQKTQRKKPEYEANPGGFYELAKRVQMQPRFPELFEGKLIKVLFRGLGNLYPGNYKVVYMLRNPEEISASMEKVGMRPRRLGWSRPEDYFDVMQHYLTVADNRKDMEIIQMWYSDVIDDPIKAFGKVKAFGIPVDVRLASKVVTSNLYRNRA